MRIARRLARCRGYSRSIVARAPRETRFTAASGLSWLLLAHLNETGRDVPAIVRQSGARLGDLLNPEVRIPLSQMHALWRAAAAVCEDEALGIAIVNRIDPSSTASWPEPFSLLEHLGRASATLREGAPLQRRFMRLLRDGLTLSLDGPHERPILRFEFALADEPRELIHFHLASSILYLRRVLNDTHSVLEEIWFAEPKPKNEQGFTSFFRAPLRWDAACYAIVTSGEVLDRPIPGANPMLLSVVQRRAERAVAGLPALDDFAELVRERVEAELEAGTTNASSIAEKLGMSQRTLHRRLQSEGTSYQEVLDKLRCRLAWRYLASRKHTINEVAALVGFAQPSAFHRAFKSWTGETPSDYQERFASAPTPVSSPPRRA